jgi:hypothetical protein
MSAATKIAMSRRPHSLIGPALSRGEGIKKKLMAFSPQTNYTERATAACRRS